MTEQDFKNIESALNLALPAEYRSVMTGAKYREEDERSHGGLYNDPQYVIHDTIWLHEVMESYDLPCPKSWVVLSQINGGDLVFIDVNEPGTPLRYWNHETLAVEDATDTIRFFVDSTIEAMRKAKDEARSS